MGLLLDPAGLCIGRIVPINHFGLCSISAIVAKTNFLRFGLILSVASPGTLYIVPASTAPAANASAASGPPLNPKIAAVPATFVKS